MVLRDSFSDPQAVARYAEGPVRLVPGFEALQRMAMLLLAERMPDAGSVLVHGAGGGLEIKAFAQAHPGWRFEGVDPSSDMLELATVTLGPLADRVRLHHSLIDAAPDGPFDAATSLLVMHFITREERRRTLAEIRRRLRPGAPLVVAHHSVAADPAVRNTWFTRFAAFAQSSAVAPADAQKAGRTIGEQLPILDPEEDERLLREAGFADVALFYAAFTFRGWVAYA